MSRSPFEPDSPRAPSPFALGELLLSADEPRAYQITRPEGTSPFLILCDHAGNAVPRKLAGLGLSADNLSRHIGWDIGAAAVSRRLSDQLDATFIAQAYSRLVIDCNRPTDSVDSIVEVSDRIVVPGNQMLSQAERGARIFEIFEPYHAGIRAQLQARLLRGQATILLCMHSFTPVFQGFVRPWHVGLLYRRDRLFAPRLLEALRAEPNLIVGDNEPYSVGDDTDVAIPEYGERRGLPHVELEMRQDLIADSSGQREWADRLARLLLPIGDALSASPH